MLRRTLFGTTFLSATVLFAQAASAQVSVDDVRAAFTAHMESLGGQVFETAETEGADTVMTGNAILFRAPLGVGTLRVVLPDYRMTPQSDGTVTLTYPETFTYRVEVDVPSEGAGTLAIEMTQSGYEYIASGTPGDVTFAQSADSFRFEVSSLDGLDDFFDLSMVGQGTDLTFNTRVEVGDMVTSTIISQNGPIEMAMAVRNPNGTVVTDTSQLGANESTVTTSFPVGGSDIMNLSPVFAAGAFIRGTIDDAGGTSETITSIDGDVVSEEFQKTSQTISRFSIDKDGLDLSAESGPAEFRVMIPEMGPVPIEGSVAGGAGALLLPLMASEAAQNFGMRLDVQDLTLSEDVWGLFDATGDLPRDPVSMNMDVSGTVMSEIDVFDFAALEQQMNGAIPPVSLESLTINELSVDAIGASALASGAFIVDNSDTTTFDGFPRPEGSAILTVSGANALLDRLVALGVLGSDEAGMARLGMGFIARSTGDDAFETRLDVNTDGHVIVNGQRMR